MDILFFAHGALCMAVSGKCYLSLHSHNASANRGACIQNCRRSYVVKDKEEDEEFVKALFRKTINQNEEISKWIEGKTQNWEVDRIATMDVLLMKMAIIEFLHFNSIPVKVSLNEYIEISKLFSTPKSKVFINGVLDKLLKEFNEKKLIKKKGRGLMQ